MNEAQALGVGRCRGRGDLDRLRDRHARAQHRGPQRGSFAAGARGDRRLAGHDTRRDRQGGPGGGAARLDRAADLQRRGRGDRHRIRGEVLRGLHADPRAREHRRPELRRDGPVRVGGRPERQGRDERSRGCAEGRRRKPGLERRPQHLGDGDLALNRSQHVVSRGEHRALRNRRRGSARSRGYRVHHSRAGRGARRSRAAE